LRFALETFQSLAILGRRLRQELKRNKKFDFPRPTLRSCYATSAYNSEVPRSGTPWVVPQTRDATYGYSWTGPSRATSAFLCWSLELCRSPEPDQHNLRLGTYAQGWAPSARAARGVDRHVTEPLQPIGVRAVKARGDPREGKELPTVGVAGKL